MFEVYGAADDPVKPADLAYYEMYQTAMDAYLARDFTHALEEFAHALQLRPNDPAAKGLISRIVALNPDELPAAWDGAVALQVK